MTTGFVPPASVADPVEDWADWLELEALRAKDRNSSIGDLLRVFRRSGTVEALDEQMPDDQGSDPGGETTEDRGGLVLQELEERLRSCRSDTRAYPFRVEPTFIERAAVSRLPQPYTFMLLLSKFGGRVGPKGINAERLFEAICAEAAFHYMGGPHEDVGVIRFGFPRRDHSNFKKAVQALVDEIGEGGGVSERRRFEKKKDGGLDLVVYRRFPDGRSGKILAFGQCASGRNWRDKTTEMQPDPFARTWLAEPLATSPLLRLFFTPFRVSSDDWFEHTASGGIVFDRCRIAAHANPMPEELRLSCATWTRYVLTSRVRP